MANRDTHPSQKWTDGFVPEDFEIKLLNDIQRLWERHPKMEELIKGYSQNYAGCRSQDFYEGLIQGLTMSIVEVMNAESACRGAQSLSTIFLQLLGQEPKNLEDGIFRAFVETIFQLIYTHALIVVWYRQTGKTTPPTQDELKEFIKQKGVSSGKSSPENSKPPQGGEEIVALLRKLIEAQGGLN